MTTKPTTFNNGIVVVDATTLQNGADVTGNLTVSGNSSINGRANIGQANISGNIAATNYFGSGRFLTGIVPYNTVTSTPGQFDGSTTNPTESTRLNYNGNFYATNFFGNGANLRNLPSLSFLNLTSAYTVTSADAGRTLNCTSGIFTITLPSAATVGVGFNFQVWNNSVTVTDAITISGSGSETIDGIASIVLRRGEGTQIISDGTNWQTGIKKTMRGYAENLSNAFPRPVASGNLAIAIGGYVNAATATSPGAIAIHGNATGGQTTAIGLNSAGSMAQAVTGAGAMALGGSYASGTDSFAAASSDNTSTYGARGANSIAIGRICTASASGTIAMGDLASASVTGAIAFGNSVSASASYAFAVGFQSVASGIGSVALGRTHSITPATANADDSFSFGPGAIANSVRGKVSFASGDQIAAATYQSGLQLGFLTLRAQTTSATPTVLVSDAALSAASTNNQVILPNNSAFAFSALIVARRQAAGGTQSAAWKIEGLIRREASAATTTLVNSSTTVLDNTPGWTIAVSADTTNGGLAITGTGAAATNIRWVATVQTSEVVYA